MPSLNKLVARLRQDYPELNITSGECAKFTPPRSIFYAKDTTPIELLHELGHYLIKRTSYTSDIELVRIESEAWAKAEDLCKTYGVKWDDDLAQDRLDTYRNWLHVVSLCINCQLAGYQDETGIYHCPLCGKKWPSSIPPEDF